MVIGRIYDKNLSVGYWLDVRSTDAIDNVCVAIENHQNEFDIQQIDYGKVTNIDKKIIKQKEVINYG